MTRRCDWLMVDRIEQPDDAAFNLNGIGNRDFPVQQVSNRLRDHRLAVAGGAVDEHRVGGRDGRADLVEHAVAQHQMAERAPHAFAA